MYSPKTGVFARASYHSNQKLFGLLEEACHELDMKLAFHQNVSQPHGSFTQDTETLRDLTKTRADLDEAQQATSVLEHLMVYSSVAFGKENPLVHRLSVRRAGGTSVS